MGRPCYDPAVAVPAESLQIEPWAENGDREAPETVGIDRDDGWPVAYEQIGGSSPERTVFNQLLFELSSFAVLLLARGIPPWDGDVDYIHPAFVVGSDGDIYRSVVSNGPAGGNAADPVGDTANATWRAY